MAALNNFSKCFTGYTYRFPPLASHLGEFIIVYPKDINPSTSTLSFADVLKTSDFQGDPKYKLNKGDIIIASKGKSNPVAVFNDEMSDVVATSAFIIIRVTKQDLNPYFLAWYLEQPDVQNYFISRKSGTTVLNLPIKVVQDLEVPILPIEQQNLFAELYISRNKLKVTQLAILEKECQLIDLELSKKLKQYCL
jgi:restriction endonuclease S subunit